MFLFLHLYLTISLRPSNCSSPFWNNIFSAYSCHFVIDGGIYLVSEHVFLWCYVCIGRFFNYHCWPIIVESVFLSIPLLKIVCGISYPFKLCSRQRVYFCVAFGRLISCLPTGFNWFWILTPGSAYLSWKFSCWKP